MEAEDYDDRKPVATTAAKIKRFFRDYKDFVFSVVIFAILGVHLIAALVPEYFYAGHIRDAFDQNVNTIIGVVVNKTEDLKTWRRTTG